MISGSPVLGALELAGKHTKLAAARGLQLSRRWRSVRTWQYVRSRAYWSMCFMLQPLALTLGYLRNLCYCMLDTLVIWCQVQWVCNPVTLTTVVPLYRFLSWRFFGVRLLGTLVPLIRYTRYQISLNPSLIINVPVYLNRGTIWGSTNCYGKSL